MLKTVKNGSGIGVDPPPPVFFKIPPFSRFFGGGAGCYIKSMYFCVCNKKIEGWVMIKTKQEIKSVSNKMN